MRFDNIRKSGDNSLSKEYLLFDEKNETLMPTDMRKNVYENISDEESYENPRITNRNDKKTGKNKATR